MRVLDLTAGNRAIWFDRKDPRATFVDLRPEVAPDFVADSRSLPAEIGDGFNVVVFDPPHKNYGPNGRMVKDYGHFTQAEIVSLVQHGAREAWRVTVPGAVMAFKWNDGDTKLTRAVSLLAPYWEPLFGHGVSHQQRHSQTSWVMLARAEDPWLTRPRSTEGAVRL